MSGSCCHARDQLTRRAARSVALLCAALVRLGAAEAQDLEPRSYANIPTGLNFFVVGYAETSGGVLVDPTIALDDAALDIDAAIVGYARTAAIGNLLGKVDAGVGRACVSGSATYRGEVVTRDVCGFTDLKVRLTVNFLGAPALSAAEFAARRSDFVVGASLQLSAPFGDYDPARLVNIGANRWAAKAELGLWKAMQRWTLELAASGTYFEDNTDFFGASRREQEPLYALQAHVVRTLGSGIWLALSATHYAGGRTTVDDGPNFDRQSNSRVGLTAAIPVNRNHSVKLYASHGVATRVGSDFDTVGVAWQYRLGGAP